jgi:hypothetical protein
MRESGFRQTVREELLCWMEKNRARFDLLMSRITEQVAPIVAAELQAGILTRIGVVEPDERARVTMLLEQARAFIGRYAPPKADRLEASDKLLEDLDGGIALLLGRTPRPDAQ